MPDRNARTSLPFLHRNWKQATSESKSNTAIAHAARIAAGDAESTGDRENGQQRRRSSRPHQQFAQRQRISVAEEPLSIDPFFIAENPENFSSTLKINVTEFVAKETSRRKIIRGLDVPPDMDQLVLRSPARLMISIFYERHGRLQLRHTDTKDCSIETYCGANKKHLLAKVRGMDPFEISKDQLCVLRDDNVVGLANEYKLDLAFETRDLRTWPPLRLADSPGGGITNTMEWRLRTDITDMLNIRRLSAPVNLSTEHREIPTAYNVKVDIRWSTGISQAAIQRFVEQKLVPSIAVANDDEEDRSGEDADTGDDSRGTATCEVDHDTVEGQSKTVHKGSMGGADGTNGVHGANGINAINGVSGANGNSADFSEDDDDQENGTDLDTTPGRALRTRGPTKMYNLKALSDQAQGKARKARKQKDSMENDRDVDVEGVSYIFLEPHTIQLADYRCCRCGAACETVSQLQLHLEIHEDLDFNFRVNRHGRCRVWVKPKVSANGNGNPLSQANTFQLGKPTDILDLRKVAEGDSSWFTSRLGPENEPDDNRSQPLRPYQVNNTPRYDMTSQKLPSPYRWDVDTHADTRRWRKESGQRGSRPGGPGQPSVVPPGVEGVTRARYGVAQATARRKLVHP